MCPSAQAADTDMYELQDIQEIGGVAGNDGRRGDGRPNDSCKDKDEDG